jgi:hypothetical protein
VEYDEEHKSESCGETGACEQGDEAHIRGSHEDL